MSAVLRFFRMETPPKQNLQSALNDFIAKFEKSPENPSPHEVECDSVPKEEELNDSRSPDLSHVTKEDVDDCNSPVRGPPMDVQGQLGSSHAMAADSSILNGTGPDLDARRSESEMGNVSVQCSEHSIQRQNSFDRPKSDVRKSQSDIDNSNISRNHRITIPQEGGHSKSGNASSDTRDADPAQLPPRAPFRSPYREQQGEPSTDVDLALKLRENPYTNYSLYIGSSGPDTSYSQRPYQRYNLLKEGSKSSLATNSTSYRPNSLASDISGYSAKSGPTYISSYRPNSIASDISGHSTKSGATYISSHRPNSLASDISSHSTKSGAAGNAIHWQDGESNRAAANLQSHVIKKEGSPVDPAHLRFQLNRESQTTDPARWDYQRNKYSVPPFLPEDKTNHQYNQEVIKEFSKSSIAAMERVNAILYKTRQNLNAKNSGGSLSSNFSGSTGKSSIMSERDENHDTDARGSAVDPNTTKSGGKKLQSLQQLLIDENDRLNNLNKIIKEMPASIGKTPNFSVPPWMATTERRSRSPGDTLKNSGHGADYSHNKSTSGNTSVPNEMEPLTEGMASKSSERRFSPSRPTSATWNDDFMGRRRWSSPHHNVGDSYSYLQNQRHTPDKPNIDSYRSELTAQNLPSEVISGSPFYMSQMVNGTRGRSKTQKVSFSRSNSMNCNESFNTRCTQHGPIRTKSCIAKVISNKACNLRLGRHQQSPEQLFELPYRRKITQLGCRFAGQGTRGKVTQKNRTQSNVHGQRSKKRSKYEPYVPDEHESKSLDAGLADERPEKGCQYSKDACDHNLSNAISSNSSPQQQRDQDEAPPTESKAAGWQFSRKCAKMGGVFSTPLIRGPVKENMSQLEEMSKAACSLTHSKANTKGKTKSKRIQKQVRKGCKASSAKKEPDQGRQPWRPSLRSMLGFSREQTLAV